MRIKTHLANVIELADRKAQYDSEAKKIIGNKTILAWIIRYTVKELKEYTVKEIEDCIEGEPEVSMVPVYPGRIRPEAIVGRATDDKVPNEGEVTFDICFFVILPGRGKIKIILNIEIQRDYYPGYDLVTRAVFYCARMLSAQLDTEFTADNYDGIRKVYSIWICLDAPKYAADTITEYRMCQRKIFGNFRGKARYDLLTAVMICLCKESYLKKVTVLHGLLGTLFAEELQPDEKIRILEQEYGIKMSFEIEEGMRKMCNLSDAIEERGIQKGVQQGIQQGMQQGIQALIETCREFGISREDTLLKVKTKFSMTSGAAKECMVKYW